MPQNAEAFCACGPRFNDGTQFMIARGSPERSEGGLRAMMNWVPEEAALCDSIFLKSIGLQDWIDFGLRAAEPNPWVGWCRR